MEHKHTTPARPDIDFDPASAAPVGPLIPSDFTDFKTGETPITLPESELYDPAEYRWVPVRRRPRYDGWTDEKQRRFIEALADTGLVTLAAKAVGMSRESANRLRRSPHGAAFARAWDAARLHAGSALEDIAFERAIEGEERNVYNEYGEVVCTKRVVNDRLLTFLLSHLLPERYGKAARATPPTDASPPVALEASLRAMEPQLPAPPEDLLGPKTLADELEIANAADGVLPQYLAEQHPFKSNDKMKSEEIAAQNARGRAVSEKEGVLSKQELDDMCHYMDPTFQTERPRRLYR